MSKILQHLEAALASPAAALLLLMFGPKAVCYAQLALIEVQIVAQRRNANV